MQDVLFSDKKSDIDIDVVYHFLSKHSYWAKGISRRLVEKSIENSLCYGVYHQNKQVGFARVVSDFATFGYLADVFVIQEYRGFGLAKQLVSKVMENPCLQGLRRMMLATFDAHGLYSQYGFKPLARPEIMMELHRPEIYSK